MSDIDKMIREFDALINYLTSDLYDPDRRELKPLTHIIETEDEVIVTVDLPCATKNDIQIKSTEDTLTIKASLNKELSLIEKFDCYNKHIKLPTRVEPKESKAYFNNGVLQVKLKKKLEGKEIRVE
ncbi:MAG: Hsp20/alpha crystallin family protein [Candidatus Nitrosocaldaceae archaeon]